MNITHKNTVVFLLFFSAACYWPVPLQLLLVDADCGEAVLQQADLPHSATQQATQRVCGNQTIKYINTDNIQFTIIYKLMYQI